ncbi:response regulator [Paradesulfitobacterium ferrireducens]|uniref:response regulator n=1 Tax=Paradesulfitobacterium ferrireducens TaxID=2816476 RepID=UPI001A90A063|nr:response regulator [Paradesulfitobacterium ferrireducens]
MSTILVADDASFMRLMIRQILARQGYTEIFEAENGKVAVSLFQTHKPDLALLDITMPELDGLAALKEILAFEPKAKVVMCSAIAQENMVREALKLGALDFVVKPFRPEELLKTVTKYLS